MDRSEYDETRATARLPNLDIEIVHRLPINPVQFERVTSVAD